MLISAVVIFFISNLATAWFVKNKYQQLAIKALQYSAETETAINETHEENKKLKQAVADIKYKNKELEKDLAAARH
ncbi:MAG: hypothetical protein KAG18_06535 [Sinobacterium sp.]|nr:hypothetical protein [Sinobacterium sp.]